MGTIHERDDAREIYSERSLQDFFPELLPYIFPSSHILDVGCGPGSITLDVAAKATSGSVFGIDAAAPSIDQALKAVEETGVANVDFKIGNAYDLPFSDETFDLTYSHAVVGWLEKPIEALEEQRRVLKHGGFTLFTIPDLDGVIIYPECPAFESVRNAWRSLSNPIDDSFFIEWFCGRKCIEYVVEAGYRSARIIPCHPDVMYAGNAEPPFQGYFDMDGIAQPLYKKLFSLGVVTRDVVAEAKRELDDWAQNKHAFYMFLKLIVAGQK